MTNDLGDPGSHDPDAGSPTDGRQYQLDPSTRLISGTDTSVLIGGSPLRLMRLTARGRDRFLAIASGRSVAPSPLLERLVAVGAVHPVSRRAPERLDETTVVIPTYGRDPQRLADLVSSCRGARRIVVVDDGSPFPVGPLDGAEIIRHETNQGPAAARNTGLRTGSTAYVAFIDDDIVIDPSATSGGGDWLATLLGHFDDPDAVAVAPRIRSNPGSSELARYEEAHSPLDLGADPAIVAPGARVSYVPAAVLVVRRDALEAIGGFDVTMRFGEDVDAVWRLAQQGGRCRYDPAVHVAHEPRTTWTAWGRQRFHYGHSAAALEQRHPGAVTPVRTTGWSIAVWALAATRRPVAAAGLAAATAVALERRVAGLDLRESVRLTALGHLHAGGMLAAAVRRVWWPIVGVGALRSRVLRRVAVASCVAVLIELRAGRTGGARSPRRFLIRLADDLAYGAGVWMSVIRHREPGPLLPRMISWPGRPRDEAGTSSP